MFSYHNGFHPYKSEQHARNNHHRMVSEPPQSFVPIQNGRSASEGNAVATDNFYYDYHHDAMEDELMNYYEDSHHFEEAADHLLGLLQREANDYSVPLPIRYYPTEFDDDDKKSTSIGPWRKRIASWMYDVVDHFKYDRNVVTIALRYIDQYVSHLLMRKSSSNGEPVVKRRHFQLIAVTSLYLAIKIHGELQEEPEKGCEPVDFVLSLLAEVDGFGYKGYPKDEEEDEDSNESDDEIRALSNKIKDLRRRHRLGRLNRSGGTTEDKLGEKVLHPIPFKPRKRGMLSGPLRLNSFVELSRGLFTYRDITDTETKILKALNYVVNPPTSRRFVGEFMRIYGFCCNSIGENGNCVLGAGSHLAVKMGVDRRQIMSAVFASSCHQTEGAASVPALSLGCLPSVVAYAAVLNAIEDVFDKQLGFKRDEDMMTDEEEEKRGSYDLEDFQRHYRRYSRSQSAPIPHQHQTQAAVVNKEQYLEAWKEKFVIAVFQASNCFLAPDSEDIVCVRELLNKEVSPLPSDETQDTTSPTEEKCTDGSPTTKKRSPRSPRSVMGMSQVRFSGSSSFFSRSSSSNMLQSPYDQRSSFASSRGSDSFRSSSASQLNSGTLKRPYFKQVSAPLASEHHSARFMNNMSQFPARASTPEAPHWKYNEAGKATSEAGFDCWSSEAFQPPPFFSA
ncbi:hypothetical protein ACHAWO_003222 [Cyclotella atomus]|uniref:Cyclin N-terminal domain-containing protein n=1 Tax=Cyclotella atomus TaxID=382360 RepID=A0ABD3NTN8_9STRA